MSSLNLVCQKPILLTLCYKFDEYRANRCVQNLTLLMCKNHKHRAFWRCGSKMQSPRFLPNVHIRYMLSPVRLSSVVCLSSVCNVRAPYSAGWNFRQCFYGVRYTDIHQKFYGDRPRGTPPPGELKTRGVAKYSDFGHIDGYISETVQDRR